MNEPCKMFSVVMPFKTYERLKAMAKDRDTSVGGLLRQGADLVLRNKSGSKEAQDEN